jgi:pimeloyl-ACP methyl ester carboxylesterase
VIAPRYADAAEPEREWFATSLGLRIHVVEWGDVAAPPLLCCHGFWDHVRGFATLAPLLAERFRVLAMDARGHGDSQWAGAYSWPASIHAVVDVIRAVGAPVHLLGHSMGGGHVTDAARAVPDRVRRVVNIDGFGPPPFTADEDARLLERCAAYLDGRRAAARRADWRPYPDFDQLVERRRAQNPRLAVDWLRYFVFHAARHGPEGWRWKADPLLAHGFGPWRPEWIAPGYARVEPPMLAIVGSEPDTWGPLPEAVVGPRLAGVRRLERATVAGAGHFVHMEQPIATAQLILEFLDA